MANSRFKLDKGQVVLAALASIVLIALSVSSFTSSDRALKLATEANSATTQSTAIIISQRETLVYAVRYSEWLRGAIPRRELQIARALLAQRLAVVDFTGVSLGSRLRPSYLKALQSADELVALANTGYLPNRLQQRFQLESVSIIDAIVAESHVMIDDYSRTVSLQIKGFATSQRSASSRNLYLLLTLILVMSMLTVWTGIRIRSLYRRDRTQNTLEEVRYTEVRKELGQAKEAVQKLTNLNEAKNEFVATINHELRTPLTSIIGYVEILKDFSTKEHNGEFHKYLEVVDKNATVLLQLVESILLLSALDATESQVEFNDCDLLAICLNSVSLLQLEIESDGLEIKFEYDETDQYVVQGNASQLSQVFTNLISNAVKFSPHNSSIVIRLHHGLDVAQRDTILVEVHDNGIGIPSTEIGQLFSQFFRASNAVESSIPGSGLGLAIVRKIVEIHMGDIAVESVVGVGTTIKVNLPIGFSAVENFISESRVGVLRRAISSISAAPEEGLMDKCHEIGGSLGFYTFLQEGSQVLTFSQWLRANPDTDIEMITIKKAELLAMLRESLLNIESEIPK